MNSNTYELGSYSLFKGHIGKGSYSKIYKGYDNKKKINVAAKRLQKKNIKNINLILREIKVLKTLKHKNIMQLYNVIMTDKYFYLILEYCSNGDLRQYIKNKILSENDAKKIFTQLKDGLEYLHSKNIMHRDLKLANILINDKHELKIGDFGFARRYNSNKLLETICGSPLYLAKEIIDYNKSEGYTSKSDLWSCGIILYELFYGKPPYNPDNLTNLIKILRNYKFIEPNNNIKITPLGIDLLSKLLTIEVNDRISWEDFFNHKWFLISSNESDSDSDLDSDSDYSNSDILEIYHENNEDDLIFNMDLDNYSSNNSTILKKNSETNNIKYSSKNINNSTILKKNSETNNINYSSKNINNSTILKKISETNKININNNYIKKKILQESLTKDLKDDNYILINKDKNKYIKTERRYIPNSNEGFFKTSIRNSIKLLSDSISYMFTPPSPSPSPSI